MNEREAILGFMMAERMKSALIAGNHMLQVLETLSDGEKRGAERLFQTYLNLLINETGVAERVSPQEEWESIRSTLETGTVMMNSGVIQDLFHYLTQGISRATTVSSRTMHFLQEKGLV